MKNLLLDKYTHDLVLENYNLVLVEGIDYIRQKLKARLLFIFNEWFLDGTQGVRYFEQVLKKNPNITLIDSLIRATILETDRVNDISNYSSNFDPAQRKFTVSFIAKTDFGELPITETL